MNNLKPCPFCGSEVELEKNPLWYGNGRGYKDCYEFVIRCKKCGCRVDQPKNDSVYRSEEKAKENAIEAWNRRMGLALETVEDAPIALPFVQSEIIRCKDCENWDTTWQNDFEPNYHYCPLVDGVRNADFYCADAERRKE